MLKRLGLNPLSPTNGPELCNLHSRLLLKKFIAKYVLDRYARPARYRRVHQFCKLKGMKDLLSPKFGLFKPLLMFFSTLLLLMCFLMGCSIALIPKVSSIQSQCTIGKITYIKTSTLFGQRLIPGFVYQWKDLGFIMGDTEIVYWKLESDEWKSEKYRTFEDARIILMREAKLIGS